MRAARLVESRTETAVCSYRTRRWPRAEIVTAVVLAAVVLIATASLATGQVLGMVLVIGGLIAVVASRDRPVASLLIVALLALSSAPTVEIASVNIRVEQPAVLFLAGNILVTSRATVTRLLRHYWFLLAGLVVWLGSAAASSLVAAPDPIASLRIVAWLGISLTAGAVAAVLASRAERYEHVIGALAAAAAIHVAIALLAAASGRVLGVHWGGYMQAGDGFGFRAAGLAWEANIFASSTAIAIPLAIALHIASSRRGYLIVVGLLGLGVWVAVTRTVFVTLAFGIIVYFGWLILRGRAFRSRWLPRFLAGTLALAIGLGSGVLFSLAVSSSTPGLLANRNPAGDAAVLPPPPGATPGLSQEPGGPSQPGTPTGSAPPAGAPELLLPIDLVDASTVEFRLVRLRQSLSDLQASPWIGLGANSFGQRHADPSQSFRQDYLAMLPFTILYDAGVVGLSGFLIFFLGTAIVLLRWQAHLAAAAFAGSIAIMLASYAMTDALRFSWNWLVIGAALGLAYGMRSRVDASVNAPTELAG